jgi:hypothetical protein
MRIVKRLSREAIKIYDPEPRIRKTGEPKMKEITNNETTEKWTKLIGRLIALQPRETQYGNQTVCVIQIEGSGEIKDVYKTKSMESLTSEYLGWRICLQREYFQDGKSRIRVFIDDKTAPILISGVSNPRMPPEKDEDYDPFAED